MPGRLTPSIQHYRPDRPTIRRTACPLGRRMNGMTPPPQGVALGWANRRASSAHRANVGDRCGLHPNRFPLVAPRSDGGGGVASAGHRTERMGERDVGAAFGRAFWPSARLEAGDGDRKGRGSGHRRSDGQMGLSPVHHASLARCYRGCSYRVLQHSKETDRRITNRLEGLLS